MEPLEKWIYDNLKNGYTVQQLEQHLTKNGYDPRIVNRVYYIYIEPSRPEIKMENMRSQPTQEHIGTKPRHVNKLMVIVPIMLVLLSGFSYGAYILFFKDTSVPTGSIQIEKIDNIDGFDYVNSNQVNLNLECNDNKECKTMKFSNDGESYSEPEPYQSSKIWILSEGDGDKIVHVKYYDPSGNIFIVDGRIRLDTTPPMIASSSISGNTLSVVTNERAECRYSTINSGFSDMSDDELDGDGSTQHTKELESDQLLLASTFYVACTDVLGNKMSSAKSIEAPLPKDVILTNLCRIDYSRSSTVKSVAEDIADFCEKGLPKIESKFGRTPVGLPYKIVFKYQNNPGQAWGGNVELSIDWFEDHPNDLDAVAHEITHAIQTYPVYEKWLVEGIADYGRYLAGYGTLACDQGYEHYTDGYRCGGAFIKFIEEGYYPEMVLRLHEALREDDYSEDIFVEYTGKNISKLWSECQQTSSYCA